MAAAFWTLLTILYSSPFIYPASDLAFGALCASIVTFALTRLGLLTLVAMLLFSHFTHHLPLTTNFSAWYAGAAAAVVLAVTTLAVYGFHTSLGGRRLFNGRLLEDHR